MDSASRQPYLKCSALISCLKFRLNLSNYSFINLKCLGKNVSRNIRRRPKHGISNCDDTRILATESCDGHRILKTSISLEMDKALREDEHIALLQDLGDETIVGVGSDEPNFKGPFQD